MLVTFEVSQVPIAPSNTLAWLNIIAMLVTLPVAQVSRSWLNDDAP